MVTDRGGVFAMGSCGNPRCGQVFAFNPDLVPSIYIDPATGLPPDVRLENGQVVHIELTDTEMAEAKRRCVREPLCRECVIATNRALAEIGELPAWDENRGYQTQRIE